MFEKGAILFLRLSLVSSRAISDRDDGVAGRQCNFTFHSRDLQQNRPALPAPDRSKRGRRKEPTNGIRVSRANNVRRTNETTAALLLDEILSS